MEDIFLMAQLVLFSSSINVQRHSILVLHANIIYSLVSEYYVHVLSYKECDAIACREHR